MIDTQSLDQLLDHGTVVDQDGGKIGKVGQIYLDDESSRPEWVTVKTGLFGGAESFVPIADAQADGDELRVPFTKDLIKDAPHVSESGGHLEPEQESELYRHYGMQDRNSSQHAGGAAGDAALGAGRDADLGTNRATDGDAGRSGGRGAGRDSSADSGTDVSGPETDDAMTRSEERLDVDKERHTTGKARLRKYVVTENVTQTVPVSHEEVRIEREPITDENRAAATSGGELTEEDHEMELTEERVTVQKETVPVERVRMEKDTVTEEQQVDEQVRKEQIEADTDGDPGTGRRA